MSDIAPPPAPLLDVRDLRVVCALACAGTTAKAAAILHLTQPAVSRALLAAEDKLGEKLFERTPRRLVATAAGERLLAGASRLLIELGDLELENLIPPALASCPAEEFLSRACELDAPMAARLKSTQANNRVLRYVGALHAATGRATVGLVELERTHPFANINLTDNVVRYVTARYDRNPLVVQGPGAGPAVTAAGVFADLLRVCAYLGARQR